MTTTEQKLAQVLANLCQRIATVSIGLEVAAEKGSSSEVFTAVSNLLHLNEVKDEMQAALNMQITIQIGKDIFLKADMVFGTAVYPVEKGRHFETPEQLGDFLRNALVKSM